MTRTRRAAQEGKGLPVATEEYTFPAMQVCVFARACVRACVWKCSGERWEREDFVPRTRPRRAVLGGARIKARLRLAEGRGRIRMCVCVAGAADALLAGWQLFFGEGTLKEGLVPQWSPEVRTHTHTHTRSTALSLSLSHTHTHTRSTARIGSPSRVWVVEKCWSWKCGDTAHKSELRVCVGGWVRGGQLEYDNWGNPLPTASEATKK